MKIIATADLHYEFGDEARDRVHALADEVCQQGAEVLIIAGDTFAFDARILDACLGLFDAFGGARLLVAGNHDIWVEAGSSLTVLNEVIPAVCRKHGFTYLEEAPAVVEGFGFVGTMGWYDYSFRPRDLDVPMRFYEHKTGPGYAQARRRWRHLVEPPHPPPTEAHLRIATQWQDVRYARLGQTDPAFTQVLAEKLRRHIAAVRDDVHDIVAVLHHLPFREALRSKANPGWQFGNAFMGAEVFGEILAAEPKVRLAVYGHSHTDGIVSHGHVKGVNCGSTYRRKRYVVIDTEDWSVAYHG